MSILSLVVIEEAECIGCSRCIPACPVDAIIGSNGQMHTVIQEFCIGCKYCINACPVDCIRLTEQPVKHQPALTKTRYQARKERLFNEIQRKTTADNQAQSVDMKKAIQDAIFRKKTKNEPTTTPHSV